MGCKTTIKGGKIFLFPYVLKRYDYSIVLFPIDFRELIKASNSSNCLDYYVFKCDKLAIEHDLEGIIRDRLQHS